MLLAIAKMLFIFPIRIFTKISPLAIIKKSAIDKNASICRLTKIYWSRIGRYSYIGNNSVICNAIIGNFCSISDNCFINPGKHPLNMVSTSPVFYSKKNILRKCFIYNDFIEYEQVIIGNDVWIGVNVFIKGGVIIGDGAVIAANSVVTKDVEPYAIVGGNPAKVIRKRFAQLIVNQLLDIKWWDWPDDIISNNVQYFNSPELFISKNNNFK